jgi:predicted PurR-regulated permease PerM
MIAIDPAPHTPPSSPEPSSLHEKYMATVMAAIVVATLYFGQPIFVPLALAILLSFGLSPLVELLRRIRFGRVPSVLVSVLFAFFVIGVLGSYIGTQVGRLATELPHYQTNLVHKIHSIKGSADSSSVLQRGVALFKALSDEFLGGDDRAKDTQTSQRAVEDRPIPVRVVPSNAAPLEVIEKVAGPLLEPLATAAIVIVFVIFILLQKEDLRDRIISLVGTRDMQRTTVALDEAATKLSRYLLLQTIINATFGLIIAVGLWLIGIPNSGLWGLVAAMFRFVPYVGVPIAAIVPAALAVAVDPQWALVFWTLGLFFGIEAIVGQFIEPYVYGHNMGLSAIAVVVAAAFWIWVWGPVGLLLSTPLTMCLVVLGRHVEQLRFLDVLLGDRPPLAAEESFYLRMLASDPDETAHQAEMYVRENPLSVYYDEVAMRALMLAQKDASRGALSAERRTRIKETIEGLIENLSDREENRASSMEAEPRGRIVFKTEDLAPSWRKTPVLCVAGRGALDEAAAALLVHLLKRRGIKAGVVSSEDASPNNVQALDPDGVQAILVSYLDPGNYKNARYLVRRLHKRVPDAVPIAGFWGAFESDTHYLDSVEATGCDLVVTTLREAVDCVVALARKAANPDEHMDPVKTELIALREPASAD